MVQFIPAGLQVLPPFPEKGSLTLPLCSCFKRSPALPLPLSLIAEDILEEHDLGAAAEDGADDSSEGSGEMADEDVHDEEIAGEEAAVEQEKLPSGPDTSLMVRMGWLEEWEGLIGEQPTMQPSPVTTHSLSPPAALLWAHLVSLHSCSLPRWQDVGHRLRG